MRKAHNVSLPSITATASKASVCSRNIDGTNSTNKSDGQVQVVNVDCDSSLVLNDIFRNRKNPINGKDCFFSESTYNLVMGPGPSFEEKLLSQIARVKSEKQKEITLSSDLKPETSKQNSSPSKEKLLQNVEIKQQSRLITIDKEFDDKAQVSSLANICQKNSTEMVNCVLASDSASVISDKKVKVQKQNPEQNGSSLNAKLLRNAEVNQLFSIVPLPSGGPLSQNLNDSSVVSNVANVCTNRNTTEVINSISKTISVSNSILSEQKANINKLTPEMSEQNCSDQINMHLKDKVVNQHISLTTISTDRSIDQDFNKSLQGTSVDNSCSNKKQIESLSSERDLNIVTSFSSINSEPNDRSLHENMNSLTYLSNSEPECLDDTALMVVLDDETKINRETPEHEGLLVAADKSAKDPELSPKLTNELCLVMPSLSSDDDDDDRHFNDIHCPGNSNTYTQDKYIAAGVVTSVSREDQQPPTISRSLTENNTAVSISNSFQSIPKFEIPSDGASSALVHSMDNDYSDTHVQTEAASCQITLCSSGEMEILTDPLHQKLIQEICSDNPHVFSAHWQSASAPTWSDNDVPIFSVKQDTPKPVKCVQSAPKNQEWKKTVQLTDKVEVQPSSKKLQGEDIVAGESAKTAQSFKKSDLTKAEHQMYLKLYNKYVRSFTQGGPPPVLTEMQCKEISSFEKLQRRVLNEQAEFQNYLRENARENPQTHKFIRPLAKNYAASKARSYRLKTNYAARFNQTPISQIPFCKEANSAELRFQQTLLEVGMPPRIKLPDVQVGQKPVALQYDIHKIDTCFPRFSKRNVPGHTNHEPVSLDSNVKKLAIKYDFQVVMSSSAVKCLLDNHGPSFDRQWSLPVHIVELEIANKREKVVFLDKPLFESDLHVKDYNALFHKYALRTFVSYPRRRPTQDIKKHFHQTKPVEEPGTLDDPFDMFSSNVDCLETFGVGCSKSFDMGNKVMREESKIKFTKSLSSTDTLKSATDSTALSKSASKTLSGRRLRSKKTSYKHWDDVNDDNQISIGDISPRKNAERLGSNLNNLPALHKRGHPKKPDAHETIESEKLSHEDSELEGETKKKQTRRGQTELAQKLNNDPHHSGDVHTLQDCCKMSDDKQQKSCSSLIYEDHLLKGGNFIESATPDSAPQVDSYTRAHSPLSPVKSPRLLSDPYAVDQECIKRHSSRHFLKKISLPLVIDTPLSPDRDTPLSPDRDTPMSPDRDTPMSPDRDTPMSPDIDTPMSPDIDTPMSPGRDTPMSPGRGDTPLSPGTETPLSPDRERLKLSVKEIPLSPVRELSTTQVSPLNSSHSATISLPYGRSLRRGLSNSSTVNSSTFVPQSTSMNETPNFSGRLQSRLFTPLDSILGPSFGQIKERNDQSTSEENPSDYLPPTEVHSSIVYSLWSLHSVNLLIRTRCHGILKDHKKERRVYFSPKMEYQTSYGLEQVTVNEVAREWTSCFVRPNTNLLRARINAFTSEIMMLEELEAAQILRSSLNFKPEDGFKFLNRVLQEVLSLKCGKYLLTHESGENFCGIRSIKTGASLSKSEESAVPKKTINSDQEFHWIPIDPTILLQQHIKQNRIPATFLPKDVKVNNFNPGNNKRKYSNEIDNTNNSNSNAPWKKNKKGKKRSRKT